MSDNAPAITVRNLCKRYRIYDRPSDVFWELVSRRQRHRKFWALRDISFTVGKGEVVGIIGRNGAGKSTILRIIAGTLDASEGLVDINGKVSAILELGSGFHPEYTGRENIIMGGMCLGMTREEALCKMPEIVAFSELESVLDQPFKTYSSGMQARLTFATAVSVQPDIFIVDEALGVGDVLFQEKCFRRIREIACSGATILFVTHSLQTIYELCNRAILLHKGELLLDDEPRIVGYRYEQLLSGERGTGPMAQVAFGSGAALCKHDEGPAAEEEMLEVPSVAEEVAAVGMPGSSAPESACAETEEAKCKAVIEDVYVVNEQGDEVFTLYHGETYYVVVRMAAHVDIPKLGLAFRLQTPSGQIVYGLGSMYEGAFVSARRGQHAEMKFSLPCILASGTYLLGGGVVEVLGDTGYHVLHLRWDSRLLTVLSSEKFMGMADLKSKVVATNVYG